MAEPSAAEVIPQAIFNEGAPAEPTTTADRTASEVAKKLNEGSWREALDLRRSKAISEAVVTKKLGEIGTGIDSKTGKKKLTKAEQARVAEGKKATDFARKLIEVGYDKLAPNERAAITNRLIAHLESSPLYLASRRGKTAMDNMHEIEKLLRDPRYTKDLAELLSSHLEAESIDNNEVLEAQEAQEDTQIELDQAKLDQQESDRKYNIIEARAKAFSYNDQGEPTGDSAIKLKELRAGKSDTQIKIADYQQEVESTEARVNALRREKELAQSTPPGRTIEEVQREIDRSQTRLDNIPDQIANSASNQERSIYLRREENIHRQIDSLNREKEILMRTAQPRDIETINEELETAENDLKTARNNLQTEATKAQQLQDLETEERTLEEQRTSVLEQKRAIDLKVKKLESELARRQTVLAAAMTVRESREQDMVDGFKNVIEDATTVWLEKRVREAERIFEDELVKLKAETKDNNEKAAYDAITNRWLGPARQRRRGVLGRRRTETTRPLDRNHINNDFDALINQGPDQLLKAIMTNRINPTTNTAFTVEEINKLMQNAEFKNKLQPEMIKQLLARRQLTNGFTQEDIYAINSSQWGQNKLEEARQFNAGIKREMEAVFGAGALNRNGFGERFGQLARQKPWLIALLFGIPIVAFGALTMEAAAEAINQQR